MALNQEDKEGKDVLGEDDIYDPLLDDLDIATLMQEEDADGIVEALENPAHKTEGKVVTQEKPGIPGGVQDSDRSCHERSTSTVTSGPFLGVKNTCNRTYETSECQDHELFLLIT